MNTLTCAELLQYPGKNFTEQVRSHHEEQAVPEKAVSATSAKAPAAPLRVPHGHGALSVGRRIDIRRFVGRDRTDRIANYLRNAIPRTANWSDESLREVAERLARTVEVVE
jgi:hypothetical protein